jgi:tRNA A37 N6-isopentenylltransferase MiaA
MDITITLDPDAERFVREEAEKRGIAPEKLAETLVSDALERERKAALEREQKAERALELLRSWDEDGDEAEQRGTFDAIVKGLNEGRRGYRQHFPAHLKGKTW